MAEENLNLEAGDQAPLRLRMGETGFTGLREINGIVLEQLRKDLRWPNANRTYQEMLEDATIASAIKLTNLMIGRVKWDVKVPVDASESTKKKAKFLKQCMGDMDHSWAAFIREVVSYIPYGFSIHEKVYRRRTRANGSKYNDGLVGLKKLPIRSQTTVYEWQFDDEGRDLLGVVQDTNLLRDGYRVSTKPGKIEIPRKKFLLFRADATRDNPEGNSPLASVYVAWRIRKEIEQFEAIGVSRDLGGLPVLKIPPKYMSADASDEEKAIYDYYKRVIRNIHKNEQGGLILPQMFDPESRQPFFDFSLMSVDGKSQYDTSEIVRRWDNKILQALFADVLQLGNTSHGSFSLADSKTSILGMAIEHRLNEISDVLNHDLIPQLWTLNGWDLEELPEFKFGDIDERSLEEYSKAIQRIFSVNAVEFDRPVANDIRQTMGWELKPADEKVNKDELPMNETGASEGMAVGTTGNGTSKRTSKKDSSTSNKENV